VVDAGPVVAAKKSLASLDSPVGTVTLERGPDKRAAKAEPLYAGDVIDTGDDGTALLRFGQGRVVELGPAGRYELNADGSGLALNVLEGGVLTRFKPAAAPANGGDGDVLMSIGTPYGLTRLGTAELSIKLGDGAANVDVTLGEVEMVSKSGEVTKLGAGKKGFLGQVRELPEIALTIVVSQGRAELKAKDTRTFVAINPKKPPALKEGDVVRVKDGRFAMAPEGSQTRVALLKGAEVGIVGARKGAQKDETALDVQKGELEVVAPPNQETRLGIAPGLTLVSDLGGQFNLRRTGQGFEVDALAGDVAIEREGEAKVVVPGGQSASVPLKTGAPAVKANPREGVVLPGRAVRLFHTGLKRVAVSWDDDGQTKDWRFQLSTDPNFSTLVRDGVVHDNFANVPALPRGAWYWRVLKGSEEVEKGSVVFAPEPKSVDLSRVKNVVPAGSETTTIHFQDKDKPPVVTFTWAREEGAAKYTVRVYREGNFSSTVAERTVAETEASLPENTLAEGNYSWSVTALNAKGEEFKSGRMNKLHMTFDNGVAGLNIKTPRNGEALGKGGTTSGVVPVGSRLFINGKSVDLDGQGRFEVAVTPIGGRLVYRLVTGGAESWTVRAVRAK